jgi:hypothetical protein
MGFFRSGTLLAAVCVLVIPVTQADIYRWVGEDGAVIYSDSPPLDRNRVTDVFVSDKTAATKPPAAPSSLEIQALAGQVEQLRNELAEERRARRAAESAIQLPPPPPPIPVGAESCDLRFADCFRPAVMPYFPATVIVTMPHRLHRPHHHSPRHFKRGPQPPFLGEVHRAQPVPKVFHSGQGSFRRR